MNTPAFPHQPAINANGEHVMYGATGMSMRQYYKAAALQGLLASGMLATKPRHMTMGEMCDGIISTASQFADALLAEDEEHAKK